MELFIKLKQSDLSKLSDYSDVTSYQVISLYTYLLCKADKETGTISYTIKKIAYDTGLSENRIKTLLRILINTELVVKKNSAKGKRTTLYIPNAIIDLNNNSNKKQSKEHHKKQIKNDVDNNKFKTPINSMDIMSARKAQQNKKDLDDAVEI